MDRIYAQIVNGVVNLIGGEEVGLPHDNISDSVKVIDITELEIKPQEGWFYIDNEFVQHIPEPVETEPISETTEQKLARLEEQNLILMSALADLYEEILVLKEEEA